VLSPHVAVSPSASAAAAASAAIPPLVVFVVVAFVVVFAAAVDRLVLAAVAVERGWVLCAGGCAAVVRGFLTDWLCVGISSVVVVGGVWLFLGWVFVAVGVRLCLWAVLGGEV